MDAYPDARVPIPADVYAPRKGKPQYVQDLNLWMKDPAGSGQPVLRSGKVEMASVKPRSGLHGNTIHDWVRQYQQGVLAIDEGVGRLLAALEESGQADNTLIVFTSDQGFAWGQHRVPSQAGSVRCDDPVADDRPLAGPGAGGNGLRHAGRWRRHCADVLRGGFNRRSVGDARA